MIVKLEPGRRLLEQSTMLSVRRWEHERTLSATGDGTMVHDRIRFETRLPLHLVAGLLERGIGAFFQHRHRRLSAHCRTAGAASSRG